MKMTTRGRRRQGQLAWLGGASLALGASLLVASCAGAEPATTQSRASMFKAPVGEAGELVVLETPARARLASEDQQNFDKLVNGLVCPCEGRESESLASCLAAGEACHIADVAADTLAFHIEAGRPVPVALDQAIKDLLSAATPRTFTTEGRPRLGSPDAPIQLVVFEDFQCPHCRRVADDLPRVLEAFGEDQVSLVVKHYPLPRHAAAGIAARAAAAAQLQGGFWAFHHALFAHQAELDEALIMALADESGLDAERLLRDMQSEAIVALVEQDIAEGDAAELPGTPTVYINGLDVGDDMSVARLQRRIEVELAWRARQSEPEASASTAPVLVRSQRLVAQSDGVPGSATANAPPPSDVYPMLAEVMPLLDDANRARLVKLAESEICPCGDGGFQSLDACLRTDDGGCQLAVRVAKLAMRSLMEGESDAAIADQVVQEIEAAKKVYSFDLDGVPHKGADPAKAKVVVVEFADFKCGYCAKASALMAEIAKAHGDEVTVYFKNFPLQLRGESPMAARAALAAHQQGRFWEMHDLMFASQDDLSRERLVDLAGQLGMNVEKFEAALDDEAFAKQVERDRSEGDGARINGTPAFFINGVRFNGTFDELEAAITDHLAE